MGRKRLALILSLFALGVAGCGGDDEDGVETVPTVPLSVPGEEPPTTDDEIRTDTTVETTPETPAPAPTPTPPQGQQQPPDSPQNDTPPPQGSEAEQFENFCAENPGAC